MDAPLQSNTEDSDIDWQDVLGYDDPGYEDLINEMDVDFFLSKLPPHEAFILSRSYGIPIKMKNREIAEAVGCHQNVVPEIRDRALRKCQRIATFLKDRPLRQGDENWAFIMADPVEAPQMELLF